jgi:prepilin-type N-terminal cleavage/methylation domain-containing protein
MNERGATMIEILVAAAIFAVAATGAARALAVAERARRTSELAMRAAQLAGEGLERLRCGDRAGSGEHIGAFTRGWASRSADAALGLERLDVVVSWQEGGERSLTLSALVRAAP